MAWDTGDFRDAESNGAGGTYCANGTSGCNAWMATDNFVNGIYSGTVLLDSSLNTYLNSTYKGTLSDTSDIQIHDFPVGAVTAGNTDLAAQITAEKSSTWNGDIGLMSVSDYLRANTNTSECGNFSLNSTNYSTCATTNWIAVALKSSYPWTINANASASSTVFYVNSSGSVRNNYAVSGYRGVAPVLYLTSDISLSGSGTDIDPYEIVVLCQIVGENKNPMAK